MISLDIQEKTNWEETMANLFINKFYVKEKGEMLNKEENSFEIFFDSHDNLFQELFQEIKKLSLEDISSIPRIEENISLIKQKLNENVEEINSKNTHFIKKIDDSTNIQIYKSFLQERLITSADDENILIYSLNRFHNEYKKNYRFLNIFVF